MNPFDEKNIIIGTSYAPNSYESPVDVGKIPESDTQQDIPSHGFVPYAGVDWHKINDVSIFDESFQDNTASAIGDSDTQSCQKFDVVIVGAGVSGLATAIQIKKQSPAISVCVLEKAVSVGGHIVSGAVIETQALTELISDWEQDSHCPVKTQVKKDCFLYLTKKYAFRLFKPAGLSNTKNYVVELSKLVQWLAQKAEKMGVEIYTSTAVQDFIYHNDNSADNPIISGIKTGSFGIDKNGNKTDQYIAPMHITAKQTVLAEGARGSLTKKAIQIFSLDTQSCPQSYALGIKEVWSVPKNDKKGQILHSTGWPLNNQTYGGGFLYHISDDKIAVGMIVGLDYKNPYISPFQEFQKFKTHPAVKKHLKNGERITYGARSLTEGGLQSIPTLSFTGGLIVGCSAGFMNVAKLKGTHTAIKSGIIAGAVIAKALQKLSESIPTNPTSENPTSETPTSETPTSETPVPETTASETTASETTASETTALLNPALSPPINITEYGDTLQKSSIITELQKVRNIRPSFQKFNTIGGLLYSVLSMLLQGKEPWTFKIKSDIANQKHKKHFKPIPYPKPDNVYTFDIATSLLYANITHVANQPVHLSLKDESIPISHNLEYLDMPETRYCPAGVYSLEYENNAPVLRINAQNCLHCKTCDIKDAKQNIEWITPEGGSGPDTTL